MNVFTRGIRSAFRNGVRAVSIIVILGLSTGLALAMMVAHQAVSNKISSVQSSIGNTISITPAGFSGFSSVNNALTSSQLGSLSTLPHVTNLEESLTDRLTSIGSSSPSFGFGFNSTSNSNAQTSLKSPTQINLNRSGSGSGQGPRIFVSGGGSLPSNFSLPISIVGTNDPTSLDTNQTVTLSKGSLIDGNSNNDVALISKSMASKNNLQVGSTFTAYGTTLTVSGIFTTSTQAGADDVVVPLATEQRLSNQTGDVTSAVATVDSLANLSSVTSAIKAKLGSSADVTSSVEQAQQTVQPLNSVKSISLYSVIGAVIAGGVIILLTMVMIVRERRREIGVIKAIGASNLRVMAQFITEAVTLTILGVIIGMLLGIIAGNPITKLLVNNSTTTTTTTGAFGGRGGFPGGGGGGTRFASGGRGVGGFFRNNLTNIHAAVGWSILLYGLAAALIIAIIGSSAIAFFISKIRPAEVIRTE